jgi:hypothetical protein
MSMDTIADRANIGYRGSTFISDTAAHAGNWMMIIPIETTVFETLTDGTRGGNTFTGENIPANFPLMGNFTAIKLTSGACMAYY